VLTYAQNPNGFATVYTKANTDAPLLFSAFKYNVGFWPPAVVAKVGNLVKYTSMFPFSCSVASLLFELDVALVVVNMWDSD
jgi:hypothetical protein